MKNRTANQWLTYVISIITMVFSVSALAITDNHEYLSLAETKKLVQGKIGWRLTATKGKRTLQMLAAIPQKCAENVSLINNSALNRVEPNKQSITLDMPHCQTNPSNFNEKVTALDVQVEATEGPFYTHQEAAFSVEIDPDFSGTVQVCHLTNGPASEEIDDLRERMLCTDIQVERANGTAPKYLKDGTLVSDKTIEAQAAKLREQKEQEEMHANLAERQEQATEILVEFREHCEENDIRAAFSSLGVLESLGFEFNRRKAREDIIEVALSNLDEIEDLDDLEDIYKAIPSNKREAHSDKIVEAAIRITLENVSEMANGEGVSAAKINESINDTDKFLQKNLKRKEYKDKNIADKIAQLYKDSARIVYKNKKTRVASIDVLEKAKQKTTDDKGKIKIAKIQADIYVKMYGTCINKASNSQNFDYAANKCGKFAEKARESYNENIEFATEVLDMENEDEAEHLADLQLAQWELV